MRLKIRLRYLLKNELTIMTTIHFPSKYVPDQLSNADTKKQLQMLVKSKKMYNDKKYYIRQKVKSYKHKPSSHITNAKKCII